MTTISVTQAAVRNLAAALAKVDTTKLKHTERLDLIAEAFGWKTDAFMHSLKEAGTNPPVSRPGASIPEGSWERDGVLPLRNLGIHRLDQWESVLAKSNGVVINAGPTGSGKTTVLCASAKFLQAAGRPVYTLSDITHPIVSMSGAPVLLYGEIRDASMAAESFALAEAGFLVLATLHAGSPAGVLTRLEHYAVPASRLGLLRGVMAQRLIRRVTGEQALVADVRVFTPDAPASYNPPHGFGGDDEHVDPIVKNLVSYVRSGEVDTDEIERTFGSHIRSLVEGEVLGFKMVFAGSDTRAMRRLVDKVFVKPKDGEQ